MRRRKPTVHDTLHTGVTLSTPARSAVSEDRLRAIHAFFTDPKDDYSLDELRLIYGNDIDDVENTLDFTKGQLAEDRTTAGDFLRGYVPATIIGRAVAELPAGPLTNETRTIELPRWLWSALDQVARKHGWSVSDALSSELHAYLNDGLSAQFDDAASQPKYDLVIPTPTTPTR